MLSLLVVLAGCGGGAPAPAPAPEAPVEAPAAGPPPAEAPVPTPPSALVRGRINLQAEPPTFEPCEGTPAPATAVADAAAEVKTAFPDAPVVYVELAAHEADGGLVIDGVQVALRDGLGCAVADAEWSWRAFGNEPFWAVELVDTMATFRSAEGVHVNAVVAGGPVAGGWSWSGRDGDTTLSVRLVAERCRDTMAEAFYPARAEVTVGERTYTGCARPRP